MELRQRDEMDGSPALVSGVYLAALYALYALALRMADAWELLASGAAELRPLGPPFSLPLLLGEELALGAALGALLARAWRCRPARAAVLALFGAYLLLLAGDQLAFEAFFSHVEWVHFEDTHDLRGLAGSIAGLADAAFLAEVALALAAVAALAAPPRPRPIRRLSALVAARPKTAAAAVVAYAAASIALGSATEQHGLDRPLPVAFAGSYLAALAEQRSERERLASPRPEARRRADAEDAGAPPADDDLAPVRRALAAYRSAGGKRLSVVWYLMESTSFRDTSLAPGAPYDTTPFLAGLAGRSLLFPRFHTGVAASTRAFFSALTGLDPYMDPASDLVKYSRLAAPTVVDVLHDAGYATAFFSSSDTMFESLDAFLGAQKYDAYVDKNLVPDAAKAGMSLEAWGVDEEVVIDTALAWIAGARAAGKPYFVNYNAVYPHHPFCVPPRHRALYDRDWGEKLTRARYRAALRYADMSLERMVRGLERLGALDDTLLVVAPDHGEAFGDVHRKNFMHAEHCYEEDSHIFLLLHNPAALGPPRASARLGSHRDMPATLLDLLGVDRPLGADGRSLLAPEPAVPELRCFSRRQLALREGDLKAILDRGSNGVELYDLSADPAEQRDLAAERPAEAAAFREKILAWKAERGADLRRRVAAAGLSGEEIGGLAAKRRRELFAGSRIEITDAAICGSSAASCFAARSRSFARGSSLAARARFARPPGGDLRVEVYDPRGKRIHSAVQEGAGGAEAGVAGIPGALFSEPGRYKIKIALVRSHAVHASRILAFEIVP